MAYVIAANEANINVQHELQTWRRKANKFNWGHRLKLSIGILCNETFARYEQQKSLTSSDEQKMSRE